LVRLETVEGTIGKATGKGRLSSDDRAGKLEYRIQHTARASRIPWVMR
jgi:hypothetical protein